jgi:hypothetical protein
MLGTKRSQALEDDVDVLGVRIEVEDRVEVDAAGDLGVRADEVREVETLVPGAHRVALDEPVCVVP